MKYKEHCDFYTNRNEPVYHLYKGDCTKPVNGRFQPHKCEGVCKQYNNTAYRIKEKLAS
jgi:hypothetical protein